MKYNRICCVMLVINVIRIICFWSIHFVIVWDPRSVSRPHEVKLLYTIPRYITKVGLSYCNSFFVIFHELSVTLLSLNQQPEILCMRAHVCVRCGVVCYP